MRNKAFELNVLNKYVFDVDPATRKKTIKSPLLHKIYVVLATLHFYICLKYWVAPFRVLTLVEGWNVWKSWYFLPHIFLAVLDIYFTFFGVRRQRRIIKND